MDNYNLKLILKSELKLKMPSRVFKEIVKDTEIYDETLTKNEMIELMFEKYSIQEIKDLILNKYNNLGASINYKNLMDRLNRPSLDEKNELERKNKKNKRTGFGSPSKDHAYWWDRSGFDM